MAELGAITTCPAPSCWAPSGSRSGHSWPIRWPGTGRCTPEPPTVSTRSEEGLERTLAAIAAAKGEATGVATDVTKSEDLACLVERTVAAFGGLDALVNNAAQYWPAQGLSTDRSALRPIRGW